MIENFQNILDFSLSLEDMLVNLVVALVAGIIIAFFYRLTYKGAGFSTSFLNALIVLAMVTALVIMVIGNNLARAFGLVGAMSIIRFRTAVKDTLDIIFIFFALAIGMAAGVGLHKIALAATIFIGLVLFVISKLNILVPNKKEYLLQFIYANSSDLEEPEYIAVIKKFARKYKLVNVKSIAEDDSIELSYYIDFKRNQNKATFITELKKNDTVGHVNLFFDEEYL